MNLTIYPIAIESRAEVGESSGLQPSEEPINVNEVNIDEALTILEQALQPTRLNDLQQLVFRHAWSGQGYEAIAAELGYDHGYIRDIGSQLWHLISEALGEKVTKKNVQSALRRYQQQLAASTYHSSSSFSDSKIAFPSIVSHQTTSAQSAADRNISDRLEFPSGAVPLSSRFYVERPPIEAQVLSEIAKPGSLIRIKAPRQMGKSSLMHRLVASARQNSFQTATLNLQRADSQVFSSLDQFLRWFCANISQQLGLSPDLDPYWNTAIGSKMSCTLYMQRYVLAAIDTALLLALDEVNRIFEYPELAADFLPLLRSWYEDASEFEIWQKLRLVVVHSTEVYIPLDLNHSPFNVGLPIKLPEFNLPQMQDLARRYGLTWAAGETGALHLKALQDMIGGHPYLVRLALHCMAQEQVTLEQLLQAAPTPSGIYSEHLRSHLADLQAHPMLAIALKQVLQQEETHLEAVTAYKLESLGLIRLQGDRVSLSRKLYQIYFAAQFERLSETE